MGVPELIVDSVHEKIGKDKKLTDEAVIRHVKTHLEAFANHISWVKRGLGK